MRLRPTMLHSALLVKHVQIAATDTAPAPVGSNSD